ncbi:MAG: DivIVA domain-containing protein [bacterium]
MRLTPLDIRKQEFRKGMRGLDADEVYAFLSTVADEYEAVINDNKALRERLLELDDKVQEYRNMEKTLRDTLLTAERVTVEAKENARRESDLIVKEAQIEAEKAVRDIRTTAMKLRQEIQELRQQREGYLSRMKILVESHMKFVETAEKDFADEDREVTREYRSTVQHQETPPEDMMQETLPEKTSEIFQQVSDGQKDRSSKENDASESAAAPSGTERPTDERTPEAESERMPVWNIQEPPRREAEPRPAYQNESVAEVESGPTASVDHTAEKRQAAPAHSGEPSEWSLEKLKRDILGG